MSVLFFVFRNPGFILGNYAELPRKQISNSKMSL